MVAVQLVLLSVLSSNITQYVAPEDVMSVQNWIWGVGGILGIVVVLSTFLVVRREKKALAAFAQVARTIASGDDQRMTLPARQDADWNSLAKSFSFIQAELENRENSLRDTSLRLQTVLASMVEGVLSVDSNQVVLIANQAACEILGLEKSTLTGKKLFEIIRFPALCQAVVDVLASNAPIEIEFQTLGIRRKTVAAQIRPLTYQGDFGAAIVIHDVTEIRALETMRRDFVANVSHELKTPLASIIAYAETLQSGAIHDQKNNLQFVKQIEVQAAVLENQIRDLLQLAKVESGRTHFEFERVDVVQALRRCKDQFAAETEKRGIELRIEEEQAEVFALVDRQALQAVLENLVSNALRYTKPQQDLPRMDSPSERDPTCYVLLEVKYMEDEVFICVSDNGIGISTENQERVFERFFRVDKARSREVGGTGLGLAIVKHTVHALNGSITLQSRLGHGTTFEITFPAALERA